MEFAPQPYIHDQQTPPTPDSPAFHHPIHGENRAKGLSPFNWKTWGLDKLKTDTSAFTPPAENTSLCSAGSTCGTLDIENDMSSVDSFPLVESTEATSSFNSHFSSNSSLSGFFKSPKNSRGSNLNTKHRHSRSDSESSLFKMDRKSRSVRKEYQRLQSQCNKFKNRNNAVKANYMRLTLLPFLRRNQVTLLAVHAQTDFSIKVFAAWWFEILEVLKSNFKNVAGVDRDAFYEALSALMARPEWIDHQDQPIYQSLLSATVTYLLIKCSSIVHLPISLAAITGKVLAYAFMYVPHMAIYLISVLDISSSSIKRLGRVECDSTGFPKSTNFSHSAQQQHPPYHQHHIYQHPDFLRPLVDANSKPSTAGLNQSMSWFPFDSCQGWKQFFTADSALFASFFKHLCVLQTQAMPIINSRDSADFGDETKCFATRGESALIAAPGMRLILASIVASMDKVLADSGRTLGPRNSNPYGRSSNNSSSSSINSHPTMMSSSSTFPASTAAARPPLSGPQPPQHRFRADQMKIFTAIREILHSDETTVPYVLVFSRIFDRVMRAFATGVRVHDIDGCVTVCDIAEEWIFSVSAVKATKSCPALVTFKTLTLDWEFWLSVAKRMLRTENLHTEIRALSFLYNVWPYVPNNDSAAGAGTTNSGTVTPPSPTTPTTPTATSDSTSSSASVSGAAGNVLSCARESKTMVNLLTDWALSTDVWLQLFCHWSPLVRSYYHRLICYRIASVGENSSSWFMEAESAQYIAESRQVLQQRLAATYLWCDILSENTKMKPEIMPSLPMPRIRVGVRKVGPIASPFGTKPETNVSRVFPFDVFDTAAYWQRDANAINYNDGASTSPPPPIRSPASPPWSPATSPKKGLSRLSMAKTPSPQNVGGKLEAIGDRSPVTEQTVQRLRVQEPQTGTSPPASSSVSSSSQGNRAESPTMGHGSLKNSYLQKHWLNIRKLLTGSKQSNSPSSSTSFSSCSKQPVIPEENEPYKELKPAFNFEELRNNKDPSSVTTTHKKSSKKTDNHNFINVTPVELTRPRPEIVRPPHRFVMIPTNMRPPFVHEISHPKLPFGPKVNVDRSQFDCNRRKQEKDLAIWNYGGRSLAEWNIEVSCFEGFAKLQEKAFHETFEMFTMPFLAAEIPWKTLG